ncbi:hypothetical protein T07_13230 [Trichinella nelsoni]|uniref:Uncharacterized protein n=1 Tax=Trichinella nelsoni TaxID=6336 RepID=A0A0V0S7M1_9BILA|nr:hypothetical protein T07_13230 [Trichinella nelsoni]
MVHTVFLQFDLRFSLLPLHTVSVFVHIQCSPVRQVIWEQNTEEMPLFSASPTLPLLIIIITNCLGFSFLSELLLEQRKKLISCGNRRLVGSAVRWSPPLPFTLPYP